MVKPYHIHISSQHTMMSLILMVVKRYKIHMIVFRVLDISPSLRYKIHMIVFRVLDISLSLRYTIHMIVFRVLDISLSLRYILP